MNAQRLEEMCGRETKVFREWRRDNGRVLRGCRRVVDCMGTRSLETLDLRLATRAVRYGVFDTEDRIHGGENWKI